MTKWVNKAKHVKSRGLAGSGCAVAVIGDMREVEKDPGLGIGWSGRSARREAMKRLGVRECGGKGECDPRPEPKRDHTAGILDAFNQAWQHRKR